MPNSRPIANRWRQIIIKGLTPSINGVIPPDLYLMKAHGTLIIIIRTLRLRGSPEVLLEDMQNSIEKRMIFPFAA